jgi:FkbM family methyltransferase
MFSRAKLFLWNIVDMRRRLGLLTALRLAIYFLLKRSSTDLMRVRFKGIKSPLWLRPNSSDLETFFQVFVDGQYDFSRFVQRERLLEEYRALVALGETPLIVDCGANIGLSTIWFANLFPCAKIVAVEPAADNVELMRKNLAAYENTEIIAGGVWDEPVDLSILDRNVNPWAYQVGPCSATSDSIKSYTISAIASGRPILIIKIDIEGSEDALFRSNTDWLTKTRLLIIELHDEKLPGKKTSRNFFQRIAKEDFEFVVNGENAFFFISDTAT